MFFFTRGDSPNLWGDWKGFFFSLQFFKDFCLADLDEWSEVSKIRDPWALCWVVTRRSATQSLDKYCCLERRRHKDREKTLKRRETGNSLDASFSTALAWPFISATYAVRGNPAGSPMTTVWSAFSRGEAEPAEAVMKFDTSLFTPKNHCCRSSRHVWLSFQSEFSRSSHW